MTGLTTHILDTSAGCPAAEVRVELWQIEAGELCWLTTAHTNAQGRCSLATQLQEGEYQIRFFVGDYFVRTQLLSKPTFLQTVPVQFYVADVDQHYHVPLVVSPWAYSTYRGS